jgi:hypothetical protein
LRLPRGLGAALTLFGLLTFASSAGAECAWVMWINIISPEIWSIHGAHLTAKECSAELSSLAAFYKKNGHEIHADARSATFEKKTGERGYFRCYPDTVDPRTPKGR